ncbi:MAG: sensor histidine kinase [Myxococcales bacterium]|nr:sensor histidine kinase [Myxococcales bacterium]
MSSDKDSPTRINLDWLYRLRWGAVFGQIVTIVVAHFGLGVALPLPALSSIVATEVVFNLGVRAWQRRARRIEPRHLVWGLGFDIVTLTLLLLLSGGPHNPFSFLYLVYIALAAVVLTPRWTWSLVALAAVGSALLFVVPSHHLHIHGDGDGLFNLHLQGMWVAFTVAASFIVYFVMRVRRALAEREAELQAIHAAAERNERLSALATLAAGAAHELATPLGTIATVAKELERALKLGHSGPELLEDAQLMRAEVERCRQVLQQMSADTGATMADGFETFRVSALLDEVLAQLPAARGTVDLAWRAPAPQALLKAPRAPLRQALTNVIKNGWDACEAAGRPPRVEVEGSLAAGYVELRIRDHGAGMSAEVMTRAGEPFFSTKPTGKGMGLGLFVARSVTERLGGRVVIDSRLGEGTEVRLTLPATAAREAA